MEIKEPKMRQIRKEKGLSAYDVAKTIGVDYQVLMLYERGINVPSPDTIKKLADLYGVSMGDVMGYDDDIHEVDDKELLIYEKMLTMSEEDFNRFQDLVKKELAIYEKEQQKEDEKRRKKIGEHFKISSLKATLESGERSLFSWRK